MSFWTWLRKGPGLVVELDRMTRARDEWRAKAERMDDAAATWMDNARDESTRAREAEARAEAAEARAERAEASLEDESKRAADARIRSNAFVFAVETIQEAIAELHRRLKDEADA